MLSFRPGGQRATGRQWGARIHTGLPPCNFSSDSNDDIEPLLARATLSRARAGKAVFSPSLSDRCPQVHTLCSGRIPSLP